MARTPKDPCTTTPRPPRRERLFVAPAWNWAQKGDTGWWVRPDWKAVFFPLTVFPLFFLGAGIGMLVAVLAVVVRDVSKMVATGLGLLMFVTPVIYAPDFQNETLQAVIWWNPLTYLVGGARDIVLYGRIDHPGGYAWATLFSTLVFFLFWRLFFLSEQKVAEKA